jgi:hypothetical protein
MISGHELLVTLPESSRLGSAETETEGTGFGEDREAGGAASYGPQTRLVLDKPA